MEKQKKAAVISTDIIGSRLLTSEKRNKLQKLIESFFVEKQAVYKDLQFEQFRGDSLQAILDKHKSHSLRLSLQLSTLLKISNFGIRIGIGIGEINYNSGRVTTSDGTAFQISGPMVDELKKKNDLIAVEFDEENLNEEWETNNNSMNFILKRISNRQAEAIYLGLKELKQEDIAEKLKISQPSVHQRLKAAGADVLYSMINRFEKIMKKNYPSI